MHHTRPNAFFSPHGKVLQVLYWAALGSGTYYLLENLNDWKWIVFDALFILLISFSWFKWYREIPRRVGIEDHFDKSRVVAVWGFWLSAPLLWFCNAWFLVLPIAGLFIFLIAMNFFLVYIHSRDRDPMAPNALSGDSRVF